LELDRSFLKQKLIKLLQVFQELKLLSLPYLLSPHFKELLLVLLLLPALIFRVLLVELLAKDFVLAKELVFAPQCVTTIICVPSTLVMLPPMEQDALTLQLHALITTFVPLILAIPLPDVYLLRLLVYLQMLVTMPPAIPLLVAPLHQ